MSLRLICSVGPSLVLNQLLVLLGFWILAWMLWRKGLQKYQGASI